MEGEGVGWGGVEWRVKGWGGVEGEGVGWRVEGWSGG